MLVNLIIIYFACGSPIGVYRITRKTRSKSPLTAVGAYFILWPIFVPSILRRSLCDNGLGKTNIEREIESLRSKMEKILLARTTKVPVFEFREVFSRFTGLTMALNNDRKGNSSTELFRIAKHRHTSLASVCLDRRNLDRLSFRRMRTRVEFVDLITTISDSQPNGDEIINLGVGLAHLVNDDETVDQLLPLLGRHQKRSAARS